MSPEYEAALSAVVFFHVTKATAYAMTHANTRTRRTRMTVLGTYQTLEAAKAAMAAIPCALQRGKVVRAQGNDCQVVA